MSDDEIAFFRAAAADPQDDVVRLAYSDWLEEHGTESHIIQAQFVRLQVERAKSPVGSAEWQHFLDREAEMQLLYRRKWNGRHHHRLWQDGLGAKVDARKGDIRSWSYTRGMISSITVSMRTLLEKPNLVFDRGPIRLLRILNHRDLGTKRLPEQMRHVFCVRLPGHMIPAREPIHDQLAKAGVSIVEIPDYTLSGIAGNSYLADIRLNRIPPIVIGNITQDGKTKLAVMDPFKKWPSVKAEYENLLGKKLVNLVHHPATA